MCYKTIHNIFWLSGFVVVMMGVFFGNFSGVFYALFNGKKNEPEFLEMVV